MKNGEDGHKGAARVQGLIMLDFAIRDANAKINTLIQRRLRLCERVREDKAWNAYPESRQGGVKHHWRLKVGRYLKRGTKEAGPRAQFKFDRWWGLFRGLQAETPQAKLNVIEVEHELREIQVMLVCLREAQRSLEQSYSKVKHQLKKVDESAEGQVERANKEG